MISLDFLLVTALKGLIMLAVTGLVASIFRGAAAAIRHLIWSAGLAAVLVIPAAMALLPEWTVFSPPSWASESTEPLRGSSKPPSSTMLPSTSPPYVDARPSPIETASAGSPTGRSRARAVRGGPGPLAWPDALLGGWLLGFLGVVAWIASGRSAIRRSRSAATAIRSQEWIESIDALVADRRSTARSVTFLESSEIETPYSWGIFRPMVLLPAVGAEWIPSRRRNVLIHELAHIDRHDAASHLLARLACAVHWYNPLSWIAARQARLAREQACDDTVLAAGAVASEYASQLIATAHLDLHGLLRGALPMARRTQLGDRLAWVLDAGRPRRSFAGAALTTTVIAGVALGTPLGSLRHQERSTVTDSAGIRIVTSRAPIWDRARWTIEKVPDVDFGGGQRPEELLHEVGGMATLPDGRIGFSNGSTQQLVILDRGGKYDTAWGRSGDGPGEYHKPATVLRSDDGGVLVYDVSVARITVLDSSGHYRWRTGRVPLIEQRAPADIDDPHRPIKKGTIMSGFYPLLLGQLKDSSFVFGGPNVLGTISHEPIVRGIHEIREPVMLANADGSFRDTVAMFVTGEFAGLDPNWMSYGTFEFAKERVPYGRTPGLALHGDQIYYGDGKTYEIRVYDLKGKVVRILRRSHERREVTAKDIKAFKEYFRRHALEERARDVEASKGSTYYGPTEAQLLVTVNRKLDMLTFPTHMPAFDAIRIDMQGNTWVRDYQLPWESTPPKWTVFDTTGRWLGTMLTPANFEIYEIAEGHLLGRWQDEDDVEHVRRYPLKRSR